MSEAPRATLHGEARGVRAQLHGVSAPGAFASGCMARSRLRHRLVEDLAAMKLLAVDQHARNGTFSIFMPWRLTGERSPRCWSCTVESSMLKTLPAFFTA